MFYAWLPHILDRAAEHGCLDEDVETGDPIVCEDCSYSGFSGGATNKVARPTTRRSQ